MVRVIINPGQVDGSNADLNRDEVKHLKKVLRLKEGDEVEAFDGTGRVYRARIETLTSSRGALFLLDKGVERVKGNTPHLVFCQALIKSAKMDFIVQKATEMGVSSMYFFASSRSVPRFDVSRSTHRLHRWEKISREACKQSGRNVFPEIRGIMGFHDAIRAGRDCPMKLIFWEEEKATRFRDVLTHGQQGTTPPICFMIGPEGGFSASEIQEARAEGFIPVGLGKSILRAETAAIATLSILQYCLGELG